MTKKTYSAGVAATDEERSFEDKQEGRDGEGKQRPGPRDRKFESQKQGRKETKRCRGSARGDVPGEMRVG